MNIGDIKGQILDKAVIEKRPHLALEFGTYLGYSATRIARLLQPSSRLISVDPDPKSHAAAAVMLGMAGLSDRVELFQRTAEETLRYLASQGLQIDFLLLDHVKSKYLEDLRLA